MDAIYRACPEMEYSAIFNRHYLTYIGNHNYVNLEYKRVYNTMWTVKKHLQNKNKNKTKEKDTWVEE